MGAAPLILVRSADTEYPVEAASTTWCFVSMQADKAFVISRPVSH